MNGLEFGGTMVICNAIGAALKTKSPVPDWCIPFVLLFAGALTHCMLEGWTTENAARGAAAGVCSVGAHQIYKQYTDHVA